MSTPIKENQHSVLIVAVAFMIILQTIPYLSYMDWLPERIGNSAFVAKASTPAFYYIFRILYILILIALFSLFISIKLATKLSKEDQKPYRKYYFLLSIPILLGTIQHPYFHYYNLFFFPLLIITHLFYGSRAWATLGKKLQEENPLATVNRKELKEMGLIFDTDRGPLHVHNVFQGVMVQGGAGAGKSASVIEPAIYQWALQNMSMTIYDFKGNPPTLGLMAYNSWLLKNNSNFKKPVFQLLNIADLTRSVRPNPLDPKLIRSSIDTRSITDTLMLTLNKSWISKKDFWAESALNLAYAIGERLRKDPDLHRYCTIPHLIQLGTADPIKLIAWLRADTEIEATIRSFITAVDQNATQQLGGMLSSFQSPLTVLMSKEIYWVFGAEPMFQSDLNLNDPENPIILSISNDPTKQQALTPALSCLMRTIINRVNEQGKHPHAMVIDEFPTIYIQNFSQLPATARSNKVSTMIGIQDESQLISQYDKEADEIISNMGNQFVGMTNNTKTAKKYSELFGTYKKIDTSHSTSDSSLSFSDRINNEKLLQEKDVAQQQAGHFIGKIADGDPALFSVQTNEFKKSDHFPNWRKTLDIAQNPKYLQMIETKGQKAADDYMEEAVEMNFWRIQAEAVAILANY
jgi:type IV secretory pathway TraG/TraD family ATPase VirD4